MALDRFSAICGFDALSVRHGPVLSTDEILMETSKKSDISIIHQMREVAARDVEFQAR